MKRILLALIAAAVVPGLAFAFTVSSAPVVNYTDGSAIPPPIAYNLYGASAVDCSLSPLPSAYAKLADATGVAAPVSVRTTASVGAHWYYWTAVDSLGNETQFSGVTPACIVIRAMPPMVTTIK